MNHGEDKDAEGEVHEQWLKARSASGFGYSVSERRVPRSNLFERVFGRRVSPPDSPIH